MYISSSLSFLFPSPSYFSTHLNSVARKKKIGKGVSISPTIDIDGNWSVYSPIAILFFKYRSHCLRAVSKILMV